MLRFGMIGAGIISARHLEALDSNPGTQIIAVADIDGKKAQEAASSYGAAAYTDYKEMIDKESLDAVIINLPHYLHEESTLACARKKLHILLEKPMSVSVSSCRTMTEACRQMGVTLQIGHIQHYMPQNRCAKDIVDSMKLGKLLMIEDVRTSFYFSETRPLWFLKKELSGGGILMNLGAHSIDKIKYLTGHSIIEFSGLTGCHRPDIEVDGNAQLYMKTQNGVTATVTLCGYENFPWDETTLYFSGGILKLHTGRDLQIWKNGFFEEINCDHYPAAFDAQLNAFLETVISGCDPITNGSYSEEIIHIIESVYKNTDHRKEYR